MCCYKDWIFGCWLFDCSEKRWDLDSLLVSGKCVALCLLCYSLRVLV